MLLEIFGWNFILKYLSFHLKFIQQTIPLILSCLDMGYKQLEETAHR